MRNFIRAKSEASPSEVFTVGRTSCQAVKGAVRKAKVQSLSLNLGGGMLASG